MNIELRNGLAHRFDSRQQCLRRRAGRDDGEFFAAKAAYHVTVAEAVLHLRRHRLQHGIAGLVSVVVVEAFEVIDVAHNQAEWGAWRR